MIDYHYDFSNKFETLKEMHILYTNPKQGPFVKSKQPLNVVCKY